MLRLAPDVLNVKDAQAARHLINPTKKKITEKTKQTYPIPCAMTLNWIRSDFVKYYLQKHSI